MKLPLLNTDSVNYTDFQFQAGNFAFYCSDEHPSGVICIVESVNDGRYKLRYSNKQKTPIWAKDNQLVPVTISDKVLAQFGFEQFHNVRTKDGIIIKKCGGSLYEFEGFPICYIHELQNVYFLFTTEHLKIIK
tara:strand:+ start:871 stop:1269 length:399 start_codon:yes stop_codon:yes gene_type:complete